jgi:hypothetical protein
MSFAKGFGCLMFLLILLELCVPQGIAQSALYQEINSRVNREYESLIQLYRLPRESGAFSGGKNRRANQKN